MTSPFWSVFSQLMENKIIYRKTFFSNPPIYNHILFNCESAVHFCDGFTLYPFMMTYARPFIPLLADRMQVHPDKTFPLTCDCVLVDKEMETFLLALKSKFSIAGNGYSYEAGELVVD